MNDVIIDTNIVIWYFSQPKLSSASAQAALDAATSDGSIFVTPITIVELTYLIDKKKIPADVLVALRNALDDSASAIRVVDLNREIIRRNRANSARNGSRHARPHHCRDSFEFGTPTANE